MFLRGATALFCLLLAGSALAGDGWETYPAPKLGATVDFPGRPTTAINATYDGGMGGSSLLYTAEFDPAEGVAYGLAVTVYRRDIRDPSRFLARAVQGVRRSAKAVIVAQGAITRDGVPGLDVTLRSDKRGATTRNLFFVRGPRLYVITVLGGQSADADRFLASFHLTEPEPD